MKFVKFTFSYSQNRTLLLDGAVCTNEDIDIKFDTNVNDRATNLKIKKNIRIDKPTHFKLESLTIFCPQ